MCRQALYFQEISNIFQEPCGQHDDSVSGASHKMAACTFQSRSTVFSWRNLSIAVFPKAVLPTSTTSCNLLCRREISSYLCFTWKRKIATGAFFPVKSKGINGLFILLWIPWPWGWSISTICCLWGRRWQQTEVYLQHPNLMTYSLCTRKWHHHVS